jgi:hypothetical protein
MLFIYLLNKERRRRRKISLSSQEVYNMYYMTMLLWMFITGWEEFVGAMDFKR